MLRIWLAMGVGAFILIGSGVVASMARAQASASTGDPAAVITAYEMARNRRDLDAALAYFADDATITQRTMTFAGKDEIRKFLDGVSTRSRFVVVSDRRANGSQVIWTERSGGQGQQSGANILANGPVNPNAFTVTVEAVVQDGKIRSVAYMAGNQAVRSDPALDGRAQLPATLGLGAVAAVVLAVVVLGSITLRRSGAGSSTLRGRLMQDLRGWSAARQSL
jgi:hypothetical protein